MIIFRPICWTTEVYYAITGASDMSCNCYRADRNCAECKGLVTGHSYIEQEDKSLKCEICGHRSR